MPVLAFLSGWIVHRAIRKPLGAFTWGKLRTLNWPFLLWTGIFHLVAAEGVSSFTYYSYFVYVFGYPMASRLLRNVPLAALAVLAFSSTILIPTDEIRLQRFFFLWGIFLVGELAAEHAPLFFALSAVAT